MLRRALLDKQDEVDSEGFRLRGTEVSRVEGLTDGVFALAMTLMIVSVEVPGSFSDLLEAIKGLPVFAICFLALMWYWGEHYKFARRYGLNDKTTLFLNAVLLFVVLFYVYPLKFLFTLVIRGLVYGNIRVNGGGPMITDPQVPLLFLLYGIGFGSVAFVYLAMHWRALRRPELELTPLEVLLTRGEIARCGGQLAVAGMSISAAFLLPPTMMAIPGIIYSLTSVSEGSIGWYYGKKAGELRRAEAAGAEPSH
jgi:uncharacterized membrane protein